MRLVLRAEVMLLAVALPGCQSDGDFVNRGTTARDSAGVSIVTTYLPPDSGSSKWIVEESATVLIKPEDFGSYVLNRVTGATRLSDGRVGVLNSGNSQLLLFAANGLLEKAVGRHGEGPGEFLSPISLQRIEGDTLIVWQADYGPGTYFSPSGELIRIQNVDLSFLSAEIGNFGVSEKSTPVSEVSLVAVLRPRRNAEVSLVAGTADLENEKVGIQRPPVGYLFIDTRQKHSVFMGWYPGLTMKQHTVRGQPMTLFPPVPVTSRIAVAPREERVFIAPGHSDEIRVFKRGQLTSIIHRIQPDQEFTGEQLKMIENNFQSSNRGLSSTDLATARKAFPNRFNFPLTGTLFVDLSGCLWIKNSTRRWSVLSGSGEWLTEIDLPVNQIYEIGEDYILGTIPDRDGLQRIVIHTLHRGRE